MQSWQGQSYNLQILPIIKFTTHNSDQSEVDPSKDTAIQSKHCETSETNYEKQNRVNIDLFVVDECGDSHSIGAAQHDLDTSVYRERWEVEEHIHPLREVIRGSLCKSKDTTTADADMSKSSISNRESITNSSSDPLINIVVENYSSDDQTESASSIESTKRLNFITDTQNNNLQFGLKEDNSTVNPEHSKSLLSIDKEIAILDRNSFNLLGARDETDTKGRLSPNDFDKLKIIADRLNLETRRNSFVTWHNNLLSKRQQKTPMTPRTILDRDSNQPDDQKLLKHSLKSKRGSKKGAETPSMTAHRRISESLALIKSDLVGSLLTVYTIIQNHSSFFY